MDFDKATFSKQAVFDNVAFKVTISFDSAVFKESVSFERVSFFGETTFDKTAFNEVVSFRDAAIANKIVFTRNTFQNLAVFDGLHESGPDASEARPTDGTELTFRGVTFRAKVSFNRMRTGEVYREPVRDSRIAQMLLSPASSQTNLCNRTYASLRAML